MKKPILYLDMDGVIADHQNKEYNSKYPDYRAEHWFRFLPLIEGTKEAIEELEKVYDIYILSTPSWSAPFSWMDKRLWLEDNFGDKFKKKLILTHRKDLIVGDVLIDDRLANGSDKFKGRMIHFGSDSFPDWKTTVEYAIEYKEWLDKYSLKKK